MVRINKNPLTAPFEETLHWLRQEITMTSAQESGFNCESDQCGFSLTPKALNLFTEIGITMEVHLLF